MTLYYLIATLLYSPVVHTNESCEGGVIHQKFTLSVDASFSVYRKLRIGFLFPIQFLSKEWGGGGEEHT